jgi:hypothetical protein
LRCRWGPLLPGQASTTSGALRGDLSAEPGGSGVGATSPGPRGRGLMPGGGRSENAVIARHVSRSHVPPPGAAGTIARHDRERQGQAGGRRERARNPPLSDPHLSTFRYSYASRGSRSSEACWPTARRARSSLALRPGPPPGPLLVRDHGLHPGGTAGLRHPTGGTRQVRPEIRPSMLDDLLCTWDFRCRSASKLLEGKVSVGDFGTLSDPLSTLRFESRTISRAEQPAARRDAWRKRDRSSNTGSNPVGATTVPTRVSAASAPLVLRLLPRLVAIPRRANDLVYVTRA